jgi:hypothetical protein
LGRAVIGEYAYNLLSIRSSDPRIERAIRVPQGNSMARIGLDIVQPSAG